MKMRPSSKYFLKKDQLLEEAIEDAIFETPEVKDKVVVKKKRRKEERKNPRATAWYHDYVLSPKVDNQKFLKTFRLRFRMPYMSYQQLLCEMNNHDVFSRWHDEKKDAIGRKSAPLSLLLLSALRYLGRGWTFDDLYEVTGISDEVQRVFFHIFIDYGSTELYKKHVMDCMYKNVHTSDYTRLGFNGAVASMDGVHITTERCEASKRNLHLAHKSSLTSRAYNVSCNHRKQILNSTRGAPCTFNDKSLFLRDEFAMDVKTGNKFGDNKFKLYRYDESNEIITQEFQGAYLIVDNGYFEWSCMVAPIKNTNSRKQIWFSEYLESTRKDIECAFGILKGRWRVLKTGVRLHGVLKCDQVFFTCLALHNMLIEVDGLSDEGLWRGEWGLHDNIADVLNHVPETILRLLNPDKLREYDCSVIGSNTEGYQSIKAKQPLAYSNVPIDIKSLSFETFMNELIIHFNICFEKRILKWRVHNKSTGFLQLT